MCKETWWNKNLHLWKRRQLFSWDVSWWTWRCCVHHFLTAMFSAEHRHVSDGSIGYSSSHSADLILLSAFFTRPSSPLRSAPSLLHHLFFLPAVNPVSSSSHHCLVFTRRLLHHRTSLNCLPSSPSHYFHIIFYFLRHSKAQYFFCRWEVLHFKCVLVLSFSLAVSHLAASF